VSADIAMLQAPDKEVVQRRPGNHTQLTLLRYGPG